jgi:predicted nucleotide-binding protein
MDRDMLEKFQGANAHQLIDALLRQEFVKGKEDLAKMLVASGSLETFQKGSAIITQGAQDNDIFLLVAGSVAIVVNGHERAIRTAGQHVGEMAAIEPAQARSATVIAREPVVALRLSSASFFEIGDKFGSIWLPIARELSRRLFQRNADIPIPNTSPKVFIISSAEAHGVADEIQYGLQHSHLPRIWSQGVFFAGDYALESLEQAVAESDFAIAIAHPDDVTESRKVQQRTMRDNVLFELGLFMGRLSRHRAILVAPKIDDLKMPSDVTGLTLLKYPVDETVPLRQRLGPVCTDIKSIIEKYGVRTGTV